MRLRSLSYILLLVFLVSGCNPGHDSIDEHALQTRLDDQKTGAVPKLIEFAAGPPKVNLKPDRGQFRLGPDDVVRISVLNRAELDTTQPVRPDGKIAFFPTGDVQASGRTVEQLRDDIIARLRSTSGASYRLGIQDIVDIKVYGHDDLNSTQTIGPDGAISILPGGSIPAAGRTVDELSKEISQRVLTIVQNPIVNVSVKDYRSQPLFISEPLVNVIIQEINSQRISVLGAVRSPGIVKLRTATTLLDAVSQAGGLSDDADLRQSLVLQDGKILPIDLERLFKQGDIRQNVYMRANSSIYVASNRFNAAYVIGEVKNAGKVSWDGELSLMDAVALTGGFANDAKISHVLIISGGVANPTLKLVDVEAIQYRGELEQNVALKRGDIVYVPKTELATTERYFDFAVKVLQPILSTESAIILGGSAYSTLKGQTGGTGATINLTP